MRSAVLVTADRERQGLNAVGLWSCALGSLFPLDCGAVSPLWEPEGCVSHGSDCVLLRWMHLGTGDHARAGGTDRGFWGLVSKIVIEVQSSPM